MINEYYAKLYCSDDISLIENYHQAVSDQTRMWEIHHRRECDDEGRTLYSCKQLKEMNLYFNRPASELIFVTRSMHMKMHREMCGNGGKVAMKIINEKLTFEQRSKAGKIGGKIGGKSPSKIEKQSIPILQFSKDGKFIKEWPSLSEAYRQLGIPQSNISACLKGRYKHAGGFVWKYKS